MTPPPAEPLALRVQALRDVARGIREFELVAAEGGALPPFAPGAHLVLHTPAGLRRKYSLCNPPQDRQRYVIAVQREPGGRGGSASLHDAVGAGTVLAAEGPVQAFGLGEGASGHLFIAGGIGITPLYGMLQHLDATGGPPWQLVYLSRAPESTAYLEALRRDTRTTLHHTEGRPGARFDLWPLLEQPRGRHLYCRGPPSLMDDVKDMSGHWPAHAVHFESFREGGAARPEDRPFTVHLRRAGATVEVPPGRSLLQCLRDAGHEVVSSCESGTCGTCRTALLEGEADHRDMVLMPEEQSAFVMPCVSRAKSACLVLDL
jgi:phthalate 4,5-dioxygenase reductase subunit